MGARTKARKRAIDILFEADLRDRDCSDVLADEQSRSDRPINPYTTTVVQGFASNHERIDELISSYSRGWTIDRMPPVDRSILRVGVWELLWGDVPANVAISEAVELATQLSTDDSPAFVNGLLSQVERLHPR